MSRNKKDRLVQKAPSFFGFKPLGLQGKQSEAVILGFEEYEALNLCDYELLKQAEAALLMNISRPTFTRIYESARRKVARALVEGKPIRFANGNSSVAEWYICNSCRISFTLAGKGTLCCPVCKSGDIILNT
ncbi:MAG TPA: DUF134 domain-containing protein [Bacteroidales bacterium]|nr:DUF134 domain-containing protein [Bacteroidales bacterium]